MRGVIVLVFQSSSFAPHHFSPLAHEELSHDHDGQDLERLEQRLDGEGDVVQRLVLAPRGQQVRARGVCEVHDVQALDPTPALAPTLSVQQKAREHEAPEPGDGRSQHWN